MASAGDRIDRDWIERKQAVEAAKGRGDVEYLTRALTEPDHRGLAARALGELGAREAVPALLRLLEASDRGVRIDGIRALGELRAPEAAPRLREVASNDLDPTVRGWACAVLADLGDESTLELTLPLLEDSSITVRGSAAYTLGELGDPRALGPLRAARPRPFRAPVEWWAYPQTYREAISTVKRRAAGKAPRTPAAARRLRRARTVMQGAVLAAVAATVWLYAGFWVELLARCGARGRLARDGDAVLPKDPDGLIQQRARLLRGPTGHVRTFDPARRNRHGGQP